MKKKTTAEAATEVTLEEQTEMPATRNDVTNKQTSFTRRSSAIILRTSQQ